MQLPIIRFLHSLAGLGFSVSRRAARAEEGVGDPAVGRPCIPGPYYSLPYHSMLHCVWLNDITTHHSLTRLGP